MFIEAFIRLLLLAASAVFFGIFWVNCAVGLRNEKFVELMHLFADKYGGYAPDKASAAELNSVSIHFEYVCVIFVYCLGTAVITFLAALATKGGVSVANKTSLMLNAGIVAVHAKLYLATNDVHRKMEIANHVGFSALTFMLSFIYLIVSWLGGAGARVDVQADARAPLLLRALSGLYLVWKPLVIIGALVIHFASSTTNEALDMLANDLYSPRMYAANIGNNQAYQLLNLEITMIVAVIQLVTSLSALTTPYGSNDRKRALLFDWALTMAIVTALSLAHGAFYEAEGREQLANANISHILAVVYMYLAPGTLLLFLESVYGASASSSPKKGLPKYKTN